MEIILERLVLELLAIALQVAAMRLYHWLRTRIWSSSVPAQALVAA